MFTDSHCHLTHGDLQSQLPEVLAAMAQAQVDRALCICTTLEEADAVQGMAAAHPQLWATVGVHPDEEAVEEPTVERLIALARRPRVLAIGETGLDYYRLNGRSVADMAWQRERFARHIAAALELDRPVVVHTRSAAEDTLSMLRSEGQGRLRGVLHCFTETAETARAALDLGFFISFSGIVSFRNAQDLRDVAAWVPEDRLLIETDSPYLAPVPFRGKQNTPALVPHVAKAVADARGQEVEQVAAVTARNFDRLFQPERGA